MIKFIRNSVVFGGLVLALSVGRNEYLGFKINQKEKVNVRERVLAKRDLMDFADGYNLLTDWRDIKDEYAKGNLSELEIRVALQKKLIRDLFKIRRDYVYYGSIYKRNWPSEVALNLLEFFNAHQEHQPISYRGDPLI